MPAPGPDPRQFVKGNLLEPESYRDRLAGCVTVVHLAAATGRATVSEFTSVNVEATQALVRSCEQAGVEQFLFTSSIAATYADKRHYPYAQSKAAAEDIVRGSSLRFAIVRPTIVLGPDAPIWQTLRRMARPRVILMPGPGTARVQPIHVDDMVASLLAMIRSDRFERQTVELGGADVLSFEDLLRTIHRVDTGGEASVFHLPLGVIVAMLAGLERAIGPALPVTAGQLAAFGNDSAADPRASTVTLTPRRGIDQLIRDCVDG
jgi:NADH dehydrogenase